MKKLNRFLTAILCAIAVLILTAAPVLADSGETLTVGVPADRCPVFYIDDDEIVGIGVDLMRTAAENAGYTVVFKVVSEKSLKEALDSSEYDVIMPFGSAITSESGRATVVSDNIMQTPFTLVTENAHILPPLNELRIGMLSSLAGGAETVKQLYPRTEITLYETMPDSVKALRKGQVDALLHNSYVWSYVLQKPSYSDLRVQPSAMFSMDFRAGTLDTPEGQEIIQRLNGGIAELTDTLRQAVVLDYTSRRLYKYDAYDYIYQYGLVLILGVLLAVAITVITIMRFNAIRREQEERLRHLTDYDPLTGALSLIGFRKRAEDLLRLHQTAPYMITYVNIRNFKYINDSLGRAAGDDLLRFYVNRTRRYLSETEAICRISGDHFAVLSRAEGKDGFHKGDKDVMDDVRNYFIARGKENRVQLCGGVYIVTPEDHRTVNVDRMLDCARVAEKRVRDTRQDGIEFYNPEQWEKGKLAADVTGHLQTALKNGEVQVWYQPQVDFATGKITGAEALCRWNHSKLGWLSPAVFIPMLESAGLIYELDRFVWETVCKDLSRWNEQGKRRSVSVNLSRSDINADRDIPARFHDLITTYGLTPDQLHVEITETAFAEDPTLLIDTTVKLREYGFPVEMDDFGSGYSSLHMLKEVPVDRIKLDLNFLTGTGDPERGRIIVSYMIRMVRSLGMEMIAEGVETAEQATFLKERNCTELQGYYFHKPMPVKDLEKLFDKTE